MSEKGFDGIIDEFEDPGMAYEEFKTGIYKRLLEAVPGEIRYDTVTTQNGEKEEVLTIKQKDTNVVPVFNVSQLWQMMQECGSMDQVFDKLMEAYAVTDSIKDPDKDFLLRFDDLKTGILARLINAERNKEKLNTLPNIPFLDLAIVFIARVKVDGQDTALTINNQLLKIWGITTDKLYETAMENKKEPLLMDKEGALLVAEANDKGMELKKDVLSQINYAKRGNVLPEQMEEPGFLVTFKDMRYGAAAMADNEFLRSCAEKFGCGMYIIPCSIHGVMFIPSDDGGENLRLFNNTAKKMAREAVEEGDVLSDHAYYYDKEIGGIIY